MTRTARVLTVAAFIAFVGFTTLLAARVTADFRRADQIDACAVAYRTQFVPQPDGRPVWTSDACRTLSLNDKAAVYARVVVAYQADVERSKTAAHASQTASTVTASAPAKATTGATTAAVDGVRTAPTARVATP